MIRTKMLWRELIRSTKVRSRAIACEPGTPLDKSSRCSVCSRGAWKLCASTRASTPERRSKSWNACSVPCSTPSSGFFSLYVMMASITTISTSGVAVPQMAHATAADTASAASTGASHRIHNGFIWFGDSAHFTSASGCTPTPTSSPSTARSSRRSS